jgi:hypothetical protein
MSVTFKAFLRQVIKRVEVSKGFHPYPNRATAPPGGLGHWDATQSSPSAPQIREVPFDLIKLGATALHNRVWQAALIRNRRLPNPALIEAVVRGYQAYTVCWTARWRAWRTSPQKIPVRGRYIVRILCRGFLVPDIVEAALRVKQPAGFTKARRPRFGSQMLVGSLPRPDFSGVFA